MGCLVPLLALISPRLALFVILLFSGWIGEALDGWIVPVLGFFFLPWTLLAYVVMYQVSPLGVNGFDWFIVGFAFVVDIATYVKSSQSRTN
ncbi:MAG: hypothetical protein KDB57_03365 [Solirubrobacterales bacterium]|jgi:hypothetical protein|nr:hypothetical protein [Solirubrobacterales bacterium]